MQRAGALTRALEVAFDRGMLDQAARVVNGGFVAPALHHQYKRVPGDIRERRRKVPEGAHRARRRPGRVALRRRPCIRPCSDAAPGPVDHAEVPEFHGRERARCVNRRAAPPPLSPSSRRDRRAAASMPSPRHRARADRVGGAPATISTQVRRLNKAADTVIRRDFGNKVTLVLVLRAQNFTVNLEDEAPRGDARHPASGALKSLVVAVVTSARRRRPASRRRGSMALQRLGPRRSRTRRVVQSTARNRPVSRASSTAR